MIVFITGATAGFGAAIARRYVREGHRVVASGRRVARLEALRRELGEACHALELDVRDRGAVDDAFRALPEPFRGDAARAAKVYEGVAAALDADDIADAVYWVTTRPAHVNVNALEVMPVSQAFNAFKIDRKTP